MRRLFANSLKFGGCVHAALLLLLASATSSRAELIVCWDWPLVQRAAEQYARLVNSTVQQTSSRTLLFKAPDLEFLITAINSGDGRCMGVSLFSDWTLARSLNLDEYIKIQNDIFPLKLRAKPGSNASETGVSRGIVMLGGMVHDMFVVQLVMFLDKFRELQKQYGKR